VCNGRQISAQRLKLEAGQDERNKLKARVHELELQASRDKLKLDDLWPPFRHTASGRKHSTYHECESQLKVALRNNSTCQHNLVTVTRQRDVTAAELMEIQALHDEMSNIVNAVLLPALDKQRNAAAATATDSIAEFASPPSSSFSSVPSSSPLAPPLPPSSSSISREGGGAGGEWGGGAGGGGRVDVLMMMQREVAYMKRELSACHTSGAPINKPNSSISTHHPVCMHVHGTQTVKPSTEEWFRHETITDTLLYPLTLATMVMTILAIFASLVYGNVSPFLTLGCLDNDTEEEREGYSRTQGVSSSENARLGGEDMHVQQQHHVQPAHMDKTNDEDGCAKLSLNRRQDTKLSIRLSLARSGTQWDGDAQDMHTGNGQTVQQHVDADIKLLCDVSDEEDGTANQATDLMQPNTTSSDAPPSPSPSDTTKCSQESSPSHPPSTWSPMAMFLSAFGDMSDDNQLTSQQVLPTLSRLGYTAQECDAILEEISMSAAKDDADSGGDADGLFARTSPSTLEKAPRTLFPDWEKLFEEQPLCNSPTSQSLPSDSGADGVAEADVQGVCDQHDDWEHV